MAVVSEKSPDLDEEAAAPPELAWTRRLLRILGPGLVTGASDDDPSGIATYAQTGAQFAYAPSWTLLVSYPLMTAVQIVSARLGRTTGRGLAGNLTRLYPATVAYVAVSLLLIANTINLGADIGAMADSVRVMIGGPQIAYVAVFGGLCVAVQAYLPYDRYVQVLKWLTLSLFAYVATMYVVKVDWLALLEALTIPHVSFQADYLTAIVAIFGTTISPYLFFWQASEEVDDLKVRPWRRPLKRAPEQVKNALRRINLDTAVGMAFSNVIALAIMATAAATLHGKNVATIESSAQAAEALRPIAGPFAEFTFALGVVGTGLLAVPVLAGSAAYAMGETMQWRIGLDRRPNDARAFYATIAIATAVGAALNLTPLNPIRALYWSAVINGVVAVPIMALMMAMASERRVMGEQTIGPVLKGLGWLATAIMGVTAVGMIATSLI